MKLALTFDDGPNPPYTRDLLNILGDIPATFFLVGQHVEKYPETAKLIAERGKGIGNHSHTHAYLGQLPSGQVAWELAMCQGAIHNATGVVPKVFRPPYGNRGPSEVEKTAKIMELEMVMWDVCPGDWAAKSAEEIFSLIEGSAGGIVLLHDGSPEGGADRNFTLKAVEMLLERYPKETFTEI